MSIGNSDLDFRDYRWLYETGKEDIDKTFKDLPISKPPRKLSVYEKEKILKSIMKIEQDKN